jgi:hypothetical protein
MLIGNEVKVDTPERRESARRLLRHEHGHYIDYQDLGFCRYMITMGLPSLTIMIRNNRRQDRTKPWEMSADMNVGIFLGSFTIENYIRSMAYYEYVQSLSAWELMRFPFTDFWDFVNNEFGVLDMGKDF